MLSGSVAVFGIDDCYFGDIVIQFLSQRFCQIGIFGTPVNIEKSKFLTLTGQVIAEKLDGSTQYRINSYNKILINLESNSLLDFVDNYSEFINTIIHTRKPIFVISRIEKLNSDFFSNKLKMVSDLDSMLQKCPSITFLRIPFIYHSQQNILSKLINLASILLKFNYIVTNSRISLISGDTLTGYLSNFMEGFNANVVGEVYNTDEIYRSIHNCLGYKSYQRVWINKIVFKIFIIFFDFRPKKIRLTDDDLAMIADNSDVCNIRITINQLQEEKTRAVEQEWQEELRTFHRNDKFFDYGYAKFKDYYLSN